MTHCVASHKACRLTTYRHRFARAAPAPRAKRNDSKRNKIRSVIRFEGSWTRIARQHKAIGQERAQRESQGHIGLIIIITWFLLNVNTLTGDAVPMFALASYAPGPVSAPACALLASLR